MLVNSLEHRKIVPVDKDYVLEECSSYSLPRMVQRDVQVWLAFRRNMLSSIFRTSATVLEDIRIAKIRKRTKDKLMCCVCEDILTNHRMCIHETQVAKLIDNQNPSEDDDEQAPAEIENIDVEKRIESYELINGDDGVSDRFIQMVSYQSVKRRMIFPCSSDYYAIDFLYRKSGLARSEKGVFAGID